MTSTPIKADTLKWLARNFRRPYEDQGLSRVMIATKMKMTRPCLSAIKNTKQDPRIAQVLKAPAAELRQRV
jgi:hypothetical protein